MPDDVPFPEDVPCCDECGDPFITNDDGTTNHLDEDGLINYDQDLHHVPFTRDDPPL